MASTIAERRILRRIPVLHSLSSRELEDVKDRMVYRSYQAGEIIWRTHGPLKFTGYIQSGAVELEYRVDGVPVRTTRLYAGDPLPPRILQVRRLHNTVIARAVMDVRLGILPEPLPGWKQNLQDARLYPARGTYGANRWSWILPASLLLLVVALAWSDLTRIASGLFFLAASPGEHTAAQDPRSMSLLRAAGQIDGSAAFAYNEEGYRWFLQGRLPEAESALSAALLRDPGNAAVLNNLAIVSFVQGDIPRAASYLEQSRDQAPDNPIARYNLGVALMQNRDSAGAIREFREAGFIDPGSASPLLQQAYLYNQAGDYAAAEQRARSALELNPVLLPAHMLLGMALYNQGREAEALASFDNVLSLDARNRVASFYKALILGHLKQYDGALLILHELFTSSTNSAETARILEEIDALYRFQSEAMRAGP